MPSPITKQHIDLIADALASAMANATNADECMGVRLAITHVADAMERSNSRFNRDLFFAATNRERKAMQ